MPHVFFITEKWCEAKPLCGPTNSKYNLFGSLESSGLATQERFHFDEFYRTRGVNCDEALLSRLRHGGPRPDVVVATPFWGVHFSPAFTTYASIAALGIPLIFVCFDFVHADTRWRVLEHAPLATAVLVLDLTVDDVFDNSRLVPLWTPQDSRIFHDPGAERTIDVSFVGGRARYPDRQRALARLREVGIEVFEGGGQREQNLNILDYAAVHQRSRIALNFARECGTEHTQVKGRVFEATLCGAMLLEEDNVHIKKWFEPGKDYVPFSSPDDLAEKVRYYLDHEDERARIARNGHAKATTFYNERAFWGRVLELARACPSEEAGPGVGERGASAPCSPAIPKAPRPRLGGEGLG